jgi:hypothetical protein
VSGRFSAGGKRRRATAVGSRSGFVRFKLSLPHSPQEQLLPTCRRDDESHRVAGCIHHFLPLLQKLIAGALEYMAAFAPILLKREAYFHQ